MQAWGLRAGTLLCRYRLRTLGLLSVLWLLTCALSSSMISSVACVMTEGLTKPSAEWAFSPSLSRWCLKRGVTAQGWRENKSQV